MDVLNRIEPPTKTGSVPTEAASVSSVPLYLPNHAVDAPIVNGSAIVALRSASSAFWGQAFESSVHQDDSQRKLFSTAASGIDLKIPLPALTAEVFADQSGEPLPVTPAQSQPVSEPEPTPVEDKDDDIFVLKEMHRKRKRASDPNDGMAAQSDEVAIPSDEAERQHEKQERRRARKEAKRAAKRAASSADPAEEGVNGDPAEEQPFDYNSAPSMLNPPRESREEMRERKKKEVNPYAKALDTPKGLPRSQKERAGRSMTFQQ
jgi:exosome complex exonuclease RRP6